MRVRIEPDVEEDCLKIIDLTLPIESGMVGISKIAFWTAFQKNRSGA